MDGGDGGGGDAGTTGTTGSQDIRAIEFDGLTHRLVHGHLAASGLYVLVFAFGGIAIVEWPGIGANLALWLGVGPPVHPSADFARLALESRQVHAVALLAYLISTNLILIALRAPFVRVTYRPEYGGSAQSAGSIGMSIFASLLLLTVFLFLPLRMLALAAVPEAGMAQAADFGFVSSVFFAFFVTASQFMLARTLLVLAAHWGGRAG